MAIPLMAAAAGAQIIGGVMAGNAASKAAGKAADAQRQSYERVKALLESVGIPSIEAQEIALQNPELAGELEAEILGQSEMQNISLDPQLRQNQMNVLAQLQDLSKEGLGVEDRIALDQLGTEVAGAEQGRQQAILSGMAERGMLDSGAQLAAQLSSNQQASQNQLQQAQNIAAQASRNRINAMNQLASQSASMEGTDWNRAAQQASAADEIQRFNAQNRQSVNQYNLGQKQNLANQAAANVNQSQIHNKGLIQQDYTNRLNRAQSIAGVEQSHGNNMAANAIQKGQGQAAMYSGIGDAIGGAATAYGNYSLNQQNKKV